MKSIIPGTKHADKLNRMAMMDAFIYGTALALHDVYGFGAKRTGRVVKALAEIMNGYAEQSGGDIIKHMHAELKARKIDFDVIGRR